MTKSTSIFSRIPFFIGFLGIYPVLFLWLNNYQKIHGYVVPRSLLISFGFTTAVFLISWLLFRPVQKAGLLASIWLVLFFSYGHVFSLIDNASVQGFIFGRHRFLIPVWIVLAIVATVFILRSRSGLGTITQAANFVFGFLTAAVLLQIGLAAVSSIPLRNASIPMSAQSAAPSTSSQNVIGPQRDVYYILIDGYGRQDLLKKDLHLDISQFIADLNPSVLLCRNVDKAIILTRPIPWQPRST